MLLGERPRPPIRRTTSMTGITVDLTDPVALEPSIPQNPIIINDMGVPFPGPGGETAKREEMIMGYDNRLMGMVSPRYHRRSAGDLLETPHFLKMCGLCKRRLPPGRDIYMYRGDTAFCSLECREQQMEHDDRKEKTCSMTTSEASSKSETVAAA